MATRPAAFLLRLTSHPAARHRLLGVEEGPGKGGVISSGPAPGAAAAFPLGQGAGLLPPPQLRKARGGWGRCLEGAVAPVLTARGWVPLAP